MLTTDRRRWSEDSLHARRQALPLLQRARLAELEGEGWTLRCIRGEPAQVVVASPRKRLAILTAEGRLADAMGVALRYR